MGINAETTSNYNTMRDSNMDPSLDRSNDYFKSLNAVQGEDKSSISATSDASQAQKISDSDISKAFKDAVDGLTINKGEISAGDKLLQKHYIENYQDKFDYQDGWFISKDKSTIIGSDNAKKLVVAGENTNTSGYESKADTTVVKVDDTVKPKIFGSDKADDITVDGAKVQMISTGTGDDTINVKNGAEILTNINSGSGNDTINVDGEGTKVNGEEIVNHTGYKIRQGGIIAGDGDDTINITNKAKVKAGIYDGDGDDKINIKGGATVGTVGVEDVSDRYKSIDKYKDGREITDEDRISMEAQFQQRSGVQLGHGKNEVTIEGKDTAVSRVTGYKYNHDEGFKNEDWTNTVTVKDKATVSFDIDINSINNDKVTIDNNATVRGTIYTGKGSDTINVTNNSKVGGVRAESDGDTINIIDSTVGGKGSFYGNPTNKDRGNFNGDDSSNKGQFEGINGDGNDVFDTVNGADTITIKNSTVNGAIWGGGRTDTIEISDRSVINGIIDGEGGDDKITVNNSTVNGRAAKDSKGNDIKEAIIGGEGNDTISVQNESNVKGNISGDQGSNTITVEGGSKVAGWVYGANGKYDNMYNETGNNTITVTGENTEVSRVGDVSSGDSTITISNKAKVKSVHGDKGVDTITVDNATVAEKIEGGHGDDKIYVRNGARVEGYVSGDLDNDTIEVSGENTYVKEVKGDKGNDTITVENKAKVVTIEGNDGVDTISAKSNATVGKIYGNGGADIISLESGAKVSGSIYGDTKTMNDVHEKRVNPSLDIVDNGADADTITLSGKGTSAKNILGGDGNDIIKVKDGAKTKLIIADEGDDEVTVSGAGTYVSAINGRGGDDTILVEKGAKVDGIVGRWGNDNITITGAGTVVTENVEGNEDGDTIKILDGATVEGSVKGGNGENPSVYGAAQDSDGNNITVQNATVKGNVEGSTYGGKNIIEVSNSTIEGSVLGGIDVDEIDVTSGSKVKKTVEGGAGEDKITVTGAGTVVGEALTTPELKVNGSITGGEGNDKIVLSDGAHAVNAGIAGWGGDDKITVTGSGTRAHSISGHAGDDIIRVDNKAYIEHAVSANTGNGTVTVSGEGTSVGGIQSNGNAPITVEDGAEVRGALYAYGASGEQTIVVQSGAKVDSVDTTTDFRDDINTGGNTKDTVMVKDAGTVVKTVRTGSYDDTLIVQDGATVKNVDLGAGNDTKMTTTNNSGNLVVNSLDGDGNIDLSKIAKVAENINSVDVSAVNNAVLNVDPKDVLDLGAQDKTLEIKGGSDDAVKSKSSGQWSADGSDATHKSFTGSANDDNGVAQTVTIKVENDVTTDL
ncbi:MAG: beta strand repeat-containing protein [Campylobacter sp.]|uniref:beta strand repeat-containing protein n=1 Tax=Campylobacter sp. TaxID=205 RepID=UPI003FA18B88